MNTHGFEIQSHKLPVFITARIVSRPQAGTAVPGHIDNVNYDASNIRSRQDASTLHEIRQVNPKLPALCILIRQKAVIDELPSERIGYYDYNAFYFVVWDPGGLSDVGLKTVEACDAATGCAGVDCASKTVWAGHLAS
jgi:hypothetical protein